MQVRSLGWEDPLEEGINFKHTVSGLHVQFIPSIAQCSISFSLNKSFGIFSEHLFGVPRPKLWVMGTQWWREHTQPSIHGALGLVGYVRNWGTMHTTERMHHAYNPELNSRLTLILTLTMRQLAVDRNHPVTNVGRMLGWHASKLWSLWKRLFMCLRHQGPVLPIFLVVGGCANY